MKGTPFLALSLGLVLASCSTDSTTQGDRKARAQQQIDDALADFPGLSLSVRTPADSYTLVAGDAVIGDELMDGSTRHYAQSISKTFTAVAVLLLKQEGKIALDAKINTYLPASICGRLANGNTITVRQLLNMTSGLPDYLENERFLDDVMAGPLPMTTAQVLGYVYDRPAHFAPGTSFGYCNVNYDLLALIIDQVAPGGHSAYITEHVIGALGLGDTYYIAGTGTMTPPMGTTANYLELNGAFTDISDLQLGTVLSFVGEDGIVASTQDLATFYDKLLREKTVLAPASLAEMQTAVQYQGTPIYGLGLHFYTTASGLKAIGHEGSGAGAAAYAFYFPSKKTTVVLCTNVGTLTDPVKEQQFLTLWQQITKTVVDD